MGVSVKEREVSKTIEVSSTRSGNPIVVALDTQTAVQAVCIAKSVAAHVAAFKVGLELFNHEGPQIFGQLKQELGDQTRIFYDAKLHDIPNTVSRAVAAASRNGLWMINVHASGGLEMMRAAVQAAQEAECVPQVIAVTVLTSLSDGQLIGELGFRAGTSDQVLRLALLAKKAGCVGVVASAHEAKRIKTECGDAFLVVVPGVRPIGADHQDQKRVMGPREAIAQGADYLVIGRPITRAVDPAASASAILADLEAV